MKEVLQAVLDYVRTPGTDYAILITGPWGCGKTYFWKNVITPRLNQLPSPHRPPRVLYISLYGLSDTKEIDRSLFAQSFPGINRKRVKCGARLISTVLEALGYADLAKIDLRSLVRAKNAVICFDDLERAKIPMKEALGYINSFVEHEGAKVVILCNEDLIADEEDEDGKTYGKMKEKVVGFSLTFQGDYHEALRSLVREHRDNSAFSAFLAQHQEIVARLFQKSGTHNIRTLRRILAALRTVFEAIKNGSVDPNAVATQAIYALAPTALELHAGRANADTLRSIHSLSMLAVAGWTLRDLEDEQSYERGFVERYLPEEGWSEVVGCPPICEFLLTGFLDRAALLAWARNLTKTLDERDERIKRLSIDWRDMADGEFTQTATQVLAEVEAGELTGIGTYVTLHSTFEWFADTGLIAGTRQEMLEKFTRGLMKAEESGCLKPEPRLRRDMTHPAMNPTTDDGRTFRERVLDANDRGLARAVRGRVQAAISRLDEAPLSFIDALADDGVSGLLFTPVFSELDADDMASRILALPNALKWRFGMAMEARYEKDLPLPQFALEVPVLRRIRDVLKAHCAGSPGDEHPIPMNLFHIQQIVKVLGRAIEQLSDAEQQNDAPASGSVNTRPRNEQGEADHNSPEP